MIINDLLNYDLLKWILSEHVRTFFCFPCMLFFSFSNIPARKATLTHQKSSLRKSAYCGSSQVKNINIFSLSS